MTQFISLLLLGLKKLDQLTKDGQNFDTYSDNTDNLNPKEKRDMLLLQGLSKIRDIGNRQNVANRISGLRTMRTKNDKDVLRSFTYYALRHMVPIHVWNGSKDRMRISHIFSIHDEAFAILVMMNNWKVWESMALGEKRTRGGKTTDTLFTNKKYVLNNVNVNIKGWSNDGLKEFNVILRHLMTVRNKPIMKQLEEELLAEEKELGSINLRKRKRATNNDEIIISEREVPLDAYSLNFAQE